MELAIQTTNNEKEFKKKLAGQSIRTVVRRNETVRIYGVTLIDNNSRTVWKDPQLDRNLSAMYLTIGGTRATRPN